MRGSLRSVYSYSSTSPTSSGTLLITPSIKMSSVQMNLATLETSKVSEGQEISKTLKVPQILEILDSQRINMPLVERAQQTLETVDLPKESPEGMAIFTNHTNEVHHQHMRAALEMAEKALHGDEVPVGCVFVRNGEIIGRGMNDTNRSLCVTLLPTQNTYARGVLI